MLCNVQLEVTREDVPTPWVYTVDLIVPPEARAYVDLDQRCEQQARDMARTLGLKVHRMVAMDFVEYETDQHL